MRQRKIKNEDEIIESYSRYIVSDPASQRGRWQEIFAERSKEEMPTDEALQEEDRPSRPIFLEIGCGKGQFITTLAQQNPDKLYIAVEGARSVVLRALEKAGGKELSNLLFIVDYVNELSELFDKGEVAGLYLNFSDPWPKDRHAKRRLTHSRYLQSYQRILPEGSFLEFKTDNDKLFAFSLEEFQQNGLVVLECTQDLHKSEFAEKNVPTEYEEKFSKLWKKINYCKVQM